LAAWACFLFDQQTLSMIWEQRNSDIHRDMPHCHGIPWGIVYLCGIPMAILHHDPKSGGYRNQKSGHVRHVWHVLVAKPKIGHFCHFRADMSWHVAKMDTFSTPHHYTAQHNVRFNKTTTSKYFEVQQLHSRLPNNLLRFR
jgi:hypothetical protein